MPSHAPFTRVSSGSLLPVVFRTPMKLFRSVPKTWLVIVSSLLAALTVLAALHLREPASPHFKTQRDPLAPSLDAPDVTGEKGPTDAQKIGMDQIDQMAKAKFGPMPERLKAEPPDPSLHPQRPGAAALAQARHIRQIRQTQGSAAALAALKSQHQG